MVRVVIVALALGGCDYALSLKEIDELPAACGPYAQITALAFDPAIDHPHEFSIDETERHAMVVGTLMGTTRPIPLVFDAGASWWTPDASAQGGLDNSIQGAHLAWVDPKDPEYATRQDMIAWTLSGDLDGHPYTFHRYTNTGTGWSLDSAVQDAAPDQEYDVLAGNDFEGFVGPGPADIVHNVIEVLVPFDPASLLGTQVLIRANTLPSAYLEPKTSRTQPLDEAKDIHANGAGMTRDRERLVYSATRDGLPSSDVYASEAVEGQFAPGRPIVEVNTDDSDEREPWITPDCKKLYFRRVLKARPSDPGTIFVAE